MPVLETKGALSAQGYGITTQIERTYIEDVFSTWLYNGNGSTQTITNGINLAGRGGLVWLKSRSSAANNALFDTARGAPNELCSNNSAIQISGGLSNFLANGFSLNSQPSTNGSGATYVSWTFREQPRFFDVVTYTGNGANRTIAHNLGSVPGCIIVKRTDATGSWLVYHRSLGNTQYMLLNSSSPPVTGSTVWNNTTPTDTVFTVGTDASVNANGGTYVAYLFAHNAGGFGEDGTENVISCGVATLNSGGDATVSLGYEPQWIITRRTEGTVTYNWEIYDSMRKFAVSDNNTFLSANRSDAESTSSYITPTATGFQITTSLPSTDFIYIAIRRGPMRTPTTGTSVFSPYSGSAATGTKINTNFPIDTQIFTETNGIRGRSVYDRLRGVSSNTTEAGNELVTNSQGAESASFGTRYWDNTGFQRASGFTGGFAFWNFRRAPGFFDVVCYTGTGVARTVAHNLGVIPQLMIVKGRSTTTDWNVYSAATGAIRFLILNQTGASSLSTTPWNNTAPTDSVFTVGTSTSTNENTQTYVAYLFASCPGVSRVGSYTGTGATQVINCGFAAGARFVLIKRTDNTGDWYVWDSARGIVAGNDPYLTLNTNAAEVTNTDWVDTAASGFELSNAGGNLVNTNGASYIFLSVS